MEGEEGVLLEVGVAKILLVGREGAHPIAEEVGVNCWCVRVVVIYNKYVA